MAKYEEIIKGDIKKIITFLEKDIENSGISMNLVDQSEFLSVNTNVYIRVYDKYFMRNGNRASLNLTVVNNGDDIFISAIGAGGGSGVIFNFSLGAEDDMVYVVEKSVEKIKQLNL